MRRLIAVLAVLGSFSVPLLGCSVCVVVDDPDCDRTETGHKCRQVCADNGEQEDDFGETDDEQESTGSEDVDG